MNDLTAAPAAPCRVLFICLGNICRSPAAEAVFRHIVSRNHAEKRFEIDSAGLIDYHEGELPDVVDEPDVEGIPDDVLNDLILSLPPGYRMVLNLYVFEQKSHKEIGRMLNIGESSSASQFSRAKALLAKRIKEYKRKMDK